MLLLLDWLLLLLLEVFLSTDEVTNVIRTDSSAKGSEPRLLVYAVIEAGLPLLLLHKLLVQMDVCKDTPMPSMLLPHPLGCLLLGLKLGSCLVISTLMAMQDQVVVSLRSGGHLWSGLAWVESRWGHQMVSELRARGCSLLYWLLVVGFYHAGSG